MEERYQVFRHWLRKSDRPTIMKLCRLAGLNEEERNLIYMFYCDKKDEGYISDYYSKSIDTIHRWKIDAIGKLRVWCLRNTGGTASPITLEILERLLSPKKTCSRCHDECPYYGEECDPFTALSSYLEE